MSSKLQARKDEAICVDINAPVCGLSAAAVAVSQTRHMSFREKDRWRCRDVFTTLGSICLGQCAYTISATTQNYLVNTYNILVTARNSSSHLRSWWLEFLCDLSWSRRSVFDLYVICSSCCVWGRVSVVSDFEFLTLEFVLTLVSSCSDEMFTENTPSFGTLL